MSPLYDPTASPVTSKGMLAERVLALEGKVIGLLDISKSKGNFFLDRLEERLTEECHPRQIVRRTKPTFARPAPEEIRKELEQTCDVIIEALAD